MYIAIALVLHFIADFLLQSRKMGKEKSEKFQVLMMHLNIQWGVMIFGLIFFLPLKTVMIFGMANTFVHGVIDWYIWRLYKYSVKRKLIKKYELKYPDRKEAAPGYAFAEGISYEYWEDHWFYATIGLDQLLHGLTIVVLMEVLCQGI